jgi:hypothetical protein
MKDERSHLESKTTGEKVLAQCGGMRDGLTKTRSLSEYPKVSEWSATFAVQAEAREWECY